MVYFENIKYTVSEYSIFWDANRIYLGIQPYIMIRYIQSVFRYIFRIYPEYATRIQHMNIPTEYTKIHIFQNIKKEQTRSEKRANGLHPVVWAVAWVAEYSIGTECRVAPVARPRARVVKIGYIVLANTSMGNA